VSPALQCPARHSAARRDDAEFHAAPAGGDQASQAWLARVVHEMRTPLNVILGYAQLLQIDSAPETPQAQAAQKICSAGQQLLGLATDLLDHTSLRAGHFVLREEPFPLGHLLEDVADMARIAACAKGLAFRCHAVPVLPAWLVGDEDRLRQVLTNLLVNAVKFTRQGGISLEVRGHAVSASRWMVGFDVRDTGIGIADEDLARLFVPYGRLPAGVGTAGGTGLGLSISREIVRAMGSDIEVTSSLGCGSCFSFELDMALGVAPDS
jgi:signal transduction histidine kinase